MTQVGEYPRATKATSMEELFELILRFANCPHLHNFEVWMDELTIRFNYGGEHIVREYRPGS